MYTSIPHDDLLARVGEVVNEAWEWVAQREGVPTSRVRMSVVGNSYAWKVVSPRAKDSWRRANQVLSQKSLLELVAFLVHNTCVVNGGVVRRQTIGIPMGTNCGPQLCNSFLYAYESRFIDRLVRLRSVLAARRCHMTFRLIDDVLSLDNLPWRDYVTRPAVGAEDSDGDTLGGVYPASLQLNETSVSTHEVHFVGVSIKDVRGALVLDVFDKRKSFPFRVVRYPTLASTIPTHMPNGVLTGQLVRYYTICSCRKAFVD